MPNNQFTFPIQASSTQSFLDASKKLDEVCAWLTVVGINYSANRVGKYRKLFETLAEAQNAGSFSKFEKRYSPLALMNAIVERAQLVRIHDGLEHLNDPALTRRLKQAMRGNSLYILDNENRSGRDISLELDVASGFARAGYDIDFTNDADVKASKRGEPVYVECKRLKSENEISENIQKGLKQLKNRYKSSKESAACCGLLVLSVGKIINPNFGLIVERNVEEIGHLCGRYADAFVTRYSRYWHHAGADPRTLGTVIVFDVPGRITERDVPFSLHEVAIDHRMNPLSVEFQRLKEIAAAFHPRNASTT